MSKHTPGPWWVGGDRAGEGRPCNPVVRAMLDGTRRITICRTGQNNHKPYEWANARLIAAAPELLEALLGVVRVADRETVEFDAARAAIAKANGEREG